MRARSLRSRKMRTRSVRLALVASGLAAVLVAPFALTGGGVANAAVIGGASSLDDEVHVQFHDRGKDKVGDVHLLEIGRAHV